MEYITSGESHGKGMIITIKGIPSNLRIDEEFINNELKRRQGGYGRGLRMKIETDRVEILSGVRNGKATGSPITLVVWNKDYENWKDKKTEAILSPRPGHADLIGGYKFNLTDDLRDVLERSSARETAARVAGGAIARLFLKEFGIDIFSHVVNWGGIEIDTSNLTIERIKELSSNSEINSACDKETEEKVKRLIDRVREEGNTIGGIIETIILNCPPFLGSYQTYQEKLDARIAEAVLSIQAVKGIEFGLGFKYASTMGKDAHDEIYYDRTRQKYYRKTNRAGGIEGGMSNGMPIVFRAVMKPIPTLMSPLASVNIKTKEATVAIKERSDVTAVASCGVVIENSVAFVIANAIISRYGGDNVELIKKNFMNDDNLREFIEL
ncbi:MAG: chorismate synthase [Brevinematia bacterium]